MAKAVVQRVAEGAVDIPQKNYSKRIGMGIVILLGIKSGDAEKDLIFTADKCCNLRIFEDETGKMNLSLKDIKGEALIISQFTLYGETAKGNRPSFTEAAKSGEAKHLYEIFIERIKQNIGEEKVKTGIFGEMMKVTILNDGPVTLIVESK